MYRQWIKSFIDPHWEAIGRMDYARRRCLSFGTNSREARGGGGWRAVGVAWSFVKGVDTRGEGRGWRRRYKPPASFTPPPLSFPPSSPGQNRGEVCHRTISRSLERRWSCWMKLGSFFPSPSLLFSWFDESRFEDHQKTEIRNSHL